MRRIGFRDNLIYVAITAAAAIIGFSIESPDRVQLLLAVCPASVVLGWTYMVNDQKISAIGDHIRFVLRPRIARAAGAAENDVLLWEVSRYDDTSRNRRKALQLVANLLTFCLPSVAALIGYVLLTDITIWAGVVVAGESILVLGLTRELALTAELRSGNTPSQLSSAPRE